MGALYAGVVCLRARRGGGGRVGSADGLVQCISSRVLSTHQRRSYTSASRWDLWEEQRSFFGCNLNAVCYGKVAGFPLLPTDRPSWRACPCLIFRFLALLISIHKQPFALVSPLPRPPIPRCCRVIGRRTADESRRGAGSFSSPASPPPNGGHGRDSGEGDADDNTSADSGLPALLQRAVNRVKELDNGEVRLKLNCHHHDHDHHATQLRPLCTTTSFVSEADRLGVISTAPRVRPFHDPVAALAKLESSCFVAALGVVTLF